MLQPVNLDERELLIFNSADEFWATRMRGRGYRDSIGPFKSQSDVEAAIVEYFRNEEKGDISPFILHRPFSVYAISSHYGRSHICVGNVHRDGLHHPTHKEVSLKRQEERERAKRSTGRRRNS